MNNNEFLKVIGESFVKFLKTSPRSNEKLKILHGAIARDISSKLEDNYFIHSLGVGEGKEAKITGRYMEKIVDITISKNDIDIAGVAIKFVMNNYSQNSNNYFENMLGETANIRAGNKKYFQVIILPEEMPYYNRHGEIKNWERVTMNNISKYIKLSQDNEDLFFHTPVKTLIFIVSFPPLNKQEVDNKRKYKEHYLNIENLEVSLSQDVFGAFGDRVILNDYVEFIDKLIHSIKSI